jgi:hypothetical protein
MVVVGKAMEDVGRRTWVSGERDAGGGDPITGQLNGAVRVGCWAL